MDLKPGLYLQTGDSLKSLSPADTFMSLLSGSGITPTLESLAEAVAWVWVALEKRQERLNAIPYEWQVRGDEKAERDLPFTVKWADIMRLDIALQTYSVAYLHKERRGQRLLRIKFLDPTTISPDERSWDGEQYARYYRAIDHGARRELVPAEDLIIFKRLWLREVEPAPSAMGAVKLAAEILYGLNLTDRTFYRNNALPVMLVYVPPATQTTEKERLEDRFRRLFNPKAWGSTETRTVAVSQEVTVTPLSTAPKDLDASALDERQVRQILAVMGVPFDLALQNSANYATAATHDQTFTEVMGQRLQFIADTLSDDPDLMRAAVELVPRVELHSTMKRDEQAASTAFLRYVQGGVSAQGALYLVGITLDDFPSEMVSSLFVSAAPLPSVDQPEPDDEMDMAAEVDPDPADRKTVDLFAGVPGWSESAAKFYRWYTNNTDQPISAFDSDYLSEADKLLLQRRALVKMAEDYP